MPKKKSSEAQLRQNLEQQITNTAVLAKLLQGQQGVNVQAMVGIRNVSDYTVGVAAAFGAPEIHLFPAFGKENPNTSTIIPYVWWRELRKGKLLEKGFIVRDDSILGEGYQTAPEDRKEDISVGFWINVIEDPNTWITSRTETEIREDITKITARSSLIRLRRAVDDKIKEIFKSLPDTFRDNSPASNGYVPKGGWDLRHKMSVERLPALYQLVETLITTRLEQDDTL